MELNLNGNLIKSKDITYEEMVLLGKEYYAKHKKYISTSDFNLANNLPGHDVMVRLLRLNSKKLYEFNLDIGVGIKDMPMKSLPADLKIKKLFPWEYWNGEILELDYIDYDNTDGRLYKFACHDSLGYKYYCTQKLLNGGQINHTELAKFRFEEPIFLKYNIDNYLKLNNCIYSVFDMLDAQSSADYILLISKYGETRKATLNQIETKTNRFTEDGRIISLKQQWGKEISKEKASDLLISKCIELGRPLSHRDLDEWDEMYKVTSNIVTKYWGTLRNMLKELDLENVCLEHCDNITDEEYENALNAICNHVQELGRNYITSNDFSKINNIPSYFSILKYLRNNNSDLYAVFSKKGFRYVEMGFGRNYVFTDGEITKSSFEYDFSNALRLNGFKYNETYIRDIKYSDIDSDYKGNLDCDYLIKYNGNFVYIEIAGFLYKESDKKTYLNNGAFKEEPIEKYAQKIRLKEEMLSKMNLQYYIIMGGDLNIKYYNKIICDIKKEGDKNANQ